MANEEDLEGAFPYLLAIFLIAFTLVTLGLTCLVNWLEAKKKEKMEIAKRIRSRGAKHFRRISPDKFVSDTHKKEK